MKIMPLFEQMLFTEQWRRKRWANQRDVGHGRGGAKRRQKLVALVLSALISWQGWDFMEQRYLTGPWVPGTEGTWFTYPHQHIWNYFNLSQPNLT